MTRRLRIPAKRSVALAVGLVAGFLLTTRLVAPKLERVVRARLEGEAAARGLGLRLQGVRVGLSPLVRLEGVRVEAGPGWTLTADTVDVTLRILGRGLVGRARLFLGPVEVTGPAGLSLQAVPTAWDVSEVPPRGWRAEMRRPSAGLAVAWLPGTEENRAEILATAAPLGRVLTVRRAGVSLLDAGTVEGALRLGMTPEARTVDLSVALSAARVGSLGDDPADAGESPTFGLPTDATLSLAGSWRPAAALLSVPSWRATVDGAAFSGTLLVADLPRDPRLELSLEVERLDFARLLGTSGLNQPVAVASGSPGQTGEGDLGSASLTAQVKGRLADPGSFTVTQRLDFSPPRRALPALERLKGDFGHEVVLRGGARRTIAVSSSSETFIPLREVPPLFVRTLLIGEDSGFHGHRGIDLSELPSAILTNWARGDSARGASTITQQLAKNLFLSREKRLGRKLQELSLALLLEATLGKERILEIYLNIIEWGPDLYGLRPASRHYFGREPGELTPRQMAFLVSLIPGPVKYQRSFSSGALSPGFRPLVDTLLAKLRSVDALSEEEYQVAIAEELHIGAPFGGEEDRRSVSGSEDEVAG